MGCGTSSPPQQLNLNSPPPPTQPAKNQTLPNDKSKEYLLIEKPSQKTTKRCPSWESHDSQHLKSTENDIHESLKSPSRSKSSKSNSSDFGNYQNRRKSVEFQFKRGDTVISETGPQISQSKYITPQVDNKFKKVAWADHGGWAEHFDKYESQELERKHQASLDRKKSSKSIQNDNALESAFLTGAMKKERVFDFDNTDPFYATYENLAASPKRKENNMLYQSDTTDLRNLVSAENIRLPKIHYNSSKGLNYGSNYLISTNSTGALKQWSISSGTLIEDWEQVHHSRIVQVQHSTFGNR